MLDSSRGGRRRTLAVLGGGLVAGLAIAVATQWGGRDELLAEKLVAALAQAPPQKAARILAQAQRLGPPGIDVLVAGLASGDTQVSAEAGRRLRALVDSWETLAAADADVRLTRLAEQLNGRAAQFSPEDRQTAGALAMRALLWPEFTADQGHTRRVAACERLLRELHKGGRAKTVSAAPAVLAANSATDDPARRFATSLAPSATASLPGGGLPIDDARGTPPRNAVVDRVEAPAEWPVVGRVAAQPVSTSWRPARVLTDPASESPSALGSIQEDVVVESPVKNSKRDELVTLLRSTPAALGSFDLCRLTHDLDPAVSQAARAQLDRRRLDPRLIELGRMLTDPKVETRLAWTEQLTRIAGVDAEQWLVALLDDEAPAVRRAALAILITVPGRQHAPRIAQLASGDSAPEVRELAARALKPR